MNHQKFLYVSYIKTTPEELWQALTGSEFTRQYWMGNRVETDWKAGSSVKFIKQDGRLVLLGKVLACEEPKVLSYTWSYQIDEAMRAEKPSRVTFLLERFASNSELVKLTVTHDEFPDNSLVFPQISNGWPMVLSGLKTLLETKHAIIFQGCSD
jgi:uncharacterized protein YndB with AHSA1/START domain